MRLLAAGLVLAAVAIVAIGWLQAPESVTAGEAVAAAEGAFAAAGLPDAVVGRHPTAGVYRAGEGSAPVDVWRTSTSVDGGTVELWLSRDDGESVYLDDRAPDGASQLLTEAQFEELAGHYDNPAVGRQIRRNLALTVAAGLVALLALRLSAVRPRPVPPTSAPRVRAPARPDRPLRATQET